MIRPFTKKYGIDRDLFEKADYASFNDFFIRKFAAGKRDFPRDPRTLGAPAEARYLGWNQIDDTITFPVKGIELSAEKILAPVNLTSTFSGGPLLVARLCPTDYHRFHFPDDGVWDHSVRVAGSLHSVNPMVYARKPHVFSTNARTVSVLKTEHFGMLAFVEVGAMNVGKIVQSAEVGGAFKRGQEKGYFLFGASTVLVFGEAGRWRVDPGVADRTRKGVETWVPLGWPLAYSSVSNVG